MKLPLKKNFHAATISLISLLFSSFSHASPIYNLTSQPVNFCSTQSDYQFNYVSRLGPTASIPPFGVYDLTRAGNTQVHLGLGFGHMVRTDNYCPAVSPGKCGGGIVFSAGTGMFQNNGRYNANELQIGNSLIITEKNGQPHCAIGNNIWIVKNNAGKSVGISYGNPAAVQQCSLSVENDEAIFCSISTSVTIETGEFEDFGEIEKNVRACPALTPSIGSTITVTREPHGALTCELRDKNGNIIQTVKSAVKGYTTPPPQPPNPYGGYYGGYGGDGGYDGF